MNRNSVHLTGENPVSGASERGLFAFFAYARFLFFDWDNFKYPVYMAIFMRNFGCSDVVRTLFGRVAY